MLNMSFYNGTLNRPEAADVVRASNKTLYHRYGFAYRGAEKRPISKENALKIMKRSWLILARWVNRKRQNFYDARRCIW